MAQAVPLKLLSSPFHNIHSFSCSYNFTIPSTLQNYVITSFTNIKDAPKVYQGTPKTLSAEEPSLCTQARVIGRIHAANTVFKKMPLLLSDAYLPWVQSVLMRMHMQCMHIVLFMHPGTLVLPQMRNVMNT